MHVLICLTSSRVRVNFAKEGVGSGRVGSALSDFLTFSTKSVLGSMLTWGVERHQMGGGLNSPTPRQIEHCLNFDEIINIREPPV